MGGAHTIQNGLTHPELFHYIGVFSISGGGEQYEKANDAALRKAAALNWSTMPIAAKTS